MELNLCILIAGADNFLCQCWLPLVQMATCFTTHAASDSVVKAATSAAAHSYAGEWQHPAWPTVVRLDATPQLHTLRNSRSPDSCW